MNPAPMNRRHVVVGLATALAFVAIAGAVSGGRGEDRPTRAYVQWVGHETKSPQTGFSLILDDGAWRGLWAAHTGAADSALPPARHAAPKIDFTRCMVVAYFRGPSTNSDGEVLTALSVAKDLLRLRFESSTFQTAGLDARGGAVDTRPFGIWVVPRTNTPIVIEAARQGLKGEAPRWEEVHRFAGR